MDRPDFDSAEAQLAVEALARRRLQNRLAQRKRRQRRAEAEQSRRREVDDRQDRPLTGDNSHDDGNPSLSHTLLNGYDGGGIKSVTPAPTGHPTEKIYPIVSVSVGGEQHFSSYLDPNSLEEQDMPQMISFEHNPPACPFEPPLPLEVAEQGRPHENKDGPYLPPTPAVSVQTPYLPHTQIPKDRHDLPPTPTGSVQTAFSPTQIHHRTGSMSSVSANLKSPGIATSPRGNKGKTALHICAEQGNTGMFDILLDLHIDLDVPDGYGRTALHTAVQHGRVQIVARLLEAGADTEITDRDGFTPIHSAAETGNIEIVRLLARGGANIHAGIFVCEES